MTLSRVEWEWVAAAALAEKGVQVAEVWPQNISDPDVWRRLREGTRPAPGRWKCERCGRWYTHFCPDCEFRNGNVAPEDREPSRPDLLAQFARAQADPAALEAGLFEAGWRGMTTL